MPLKLESNKNIAAKYYGFTMIELLITLVILSIGLLGVANMQMLGLTYNQNAYYRSQASQLANGIVEKMRLNSAAVTTGGAYSGGNNNGDTFSLVFDISTDGSPILTSTPTLASNPDCVTNRCTSSQLATYDLINWQNDINLALPKVKDSSGTPLTTASITAYTGDRFTVVITWGEKQEDIANVNKLFADDFTSRNVTLYVQL